MRKKKIVQLVRFMEHGFGVEMFISISPDRGCFTFMCSEPVSPFTILEIIAANKQIRKLYI